MNAFTIKIIAIVAMIIDHIGLFLFPQNIMLRAIGRISFPLFAWLIANGAKHTKNVDAYVKRLLIFGVVSQITYAYAMVAINVTYPGLNVLFTLALGLLSIRALQKNKNFIIALAQIFLFAASAMIFNTDGGFIGVFSIVLFYIYFSNTKLMFLSQTLIYVAIWYLMLIFEVFKTTRLSLIQPFALVSIFFISKYNYASGPKAKYLFYLVYPMQFLIFALLAMR